MGKRLIIKNADFTANAIESRELTLLPLVKKLALDLTGNSSGIVFGWQIQPGANTRCSASQLIFVPNGAKLILSGTKLFRFDYCWYSQSFNLETYTAASESAIAAAHPYVLGSYSSKVSGNFFGVNTSGADSIVIVNNTGADCYYLIAAAMQNTSEEIPEDIGEKIYYIVEQ